jgi:serine/threonine-protein kinase
MKALEKVPADRFATAKAFAEALKNPSYGILTSTSGAMRSAALGWRQRAAVPALALAGVLAVLTIWSSTQGRDPGPISRYQVALPEGKRINATQWMPFAISPDGSKLAYMGESGRLVVRSRDQLEPVELPGTERAFNPFFSPEGTRLGYMSGAAGDAELRFVSLSGAPPVMVTSTGVGGPGASWGTDGYIYFDASGVGPLRRVRETGGQFETVSTLDSLGGELQHDWPDALPNGRGVLITVNRGGPGVNVSQSDDIAVVDLATGAHKVLVHGIFARYAASGHLLYVTSERVLMAVPFDQDRLEVTGDPVALIEGINVRTGAGGVDLAISRSGTLWYTTGTAQGESEVLWVSRAGVTSPVDPDWRGNFESLALSPDGSKLAVSVADVAGEQIWVKNVSRAGGAFSKLTHTRRNQAPRWHPDGQQVVFQSLEVANSDLRSVRADGSGTPSVLRGERYITEGSWSRDGRWLVYGGRSTTFRVFRDDIWGIRPGVDSAPVPLVATDFSEGNASVSPDGRWLLYSSNTTGLTEVYVRPFPNTSASQVQVSTGGGFRPKWSMDGREILFARASGELMRVGVTPGPAFAVSEPSRLFDLPGVVDWDVAPGGQRFVVIRSRSTSREGQLVVVENFLEELRRRSPPR